MNRGKHVLCEKPMGANAKEVKEMAEAAKASGVMLMEAMISTLCPNLITGAPEHLAGWEPSGHYRVILPVFLEIRPCQEDHRGEGFAGAELAGIRNAAAGR